MALTASPGNPLRGTLRPPGDKSISHRAMIFGLLAVGETRVTGLLEGDDVLRTAEACRALGATILRDGEGWVVRGVGIGSLLPPRDALDFGNAGTGSRLMLGGRGVIRSERASTVTPRCANGPCGAFSIRSR